MLRGTEFRLMYSLGLKLKTTSWQKKYYYYNNNTLIRYSKDRMLSSSFSCNQTTSFLIRKEKTSQELLIPSYKYNAKAYFVPQIPGYKVTFVIIFVFGQQPIIK